MKRIIVLVLLFCPFLLFAKIWTPSIITDHMVIQQNDTVEIWGWTTLTTEKITVTNSWNNQIVSTKAFHGKWSVKLKTTKAGGPYTITIEGHEKLTLSNIMMGEVWLASGQSNMEWNAKRGFNNAKEEVKKANYPNIRLFHIPKHQASTVQQDTPGEWKACTPETMREFSAVAYFFSRKLHKDLNVPIGIINSSWGGTNAEVWVQEHVVNQDSELKDALKYQPKQNWKSTKAGYMYNSMIAPLVPFKIAGTIWYQGESNGKAHASYQKLFTALIKNWRELWGYNFPFYYVQIAPFRYNEKNIGVFIREAQMKCMQIPNTGMVVVSDIGNINNIHPGNKQEVGKRLANWALANTYKKNGIAVSGPIYKDCQINTDHIIINFDYVESGLMIKGENLTHFEIAGKNGKFVKANAQIVGKTVKVWNNEVKSPQSVRFAWDNIAEPNLFNKEGLPASAFRTGK